VDCGDWWRQSHTFVCAGSCWSAVGHAAREIAAVRDRKQPARESRRKRPATCPWWAKSNTFGKFTWREGKRGITDCRASFSADLVLGV